jgi:uncharacterized cofD-like protein
MWELLRNRQLFDLKFRRQHTFGRYIADFYSNDIRLVIELDWKIHENQKEYDEIRDDIISKYWVKVLRIKNEEILNDLEWIISKISTYVPFLNSPLPLGEGQGGEGWKEKESDIPQYLQNFDPSFLNYTLPLKSPIKWHKFGNILMATLYYNFGDYNKMVNFLGGLLQTKWKVLPVTTDEAYIFAELGNSELVESQDKISNVADYKAKIDNINLLRNSKKAKLSDEVRDAILEADYLIIWPGDLYTSIYANFLIDDFRELVIEVPSKKIYILNSNNKKWETTDYEEIDFIDFIQKELEGTLNLLVANSRPPKLTEDEKKKFLSDISVKGWRYLFIEEKKKKEIKKKYPKLEFLLWEYVDKKTLYKNNMNLIEDLVEYMSLAK